jgi:5-methylcytosine-specific restriction endonuclease McrA
MIDRYKIIADVCRAVSSGAIEHAKETIRQHYPFDPLENNGRNYREVEKTKIFLRDGFIDRYSGEKLIFPPVLRVLSSAMPSEFPFHKNWKVSECHLAYWELLPTIDHIKPVSRGGPDEESNWVCTSQLRNSAKANWLLEELGWQLHSPGNLQEWDGLLGWFMEYTSTNEMLLNDSYILNWYKAGKRALQSQVEVSTPEHELSD